MKLKKMALLTLITGGILAVICPGFAYAGAAYIYEMANPTDTGYAGAGLAGRANDAGTVFTNPAGMTRFKESTALVGLTMLYLYAPFNPDNDTTVNGRDGDTTGTGQHGQRVAGTRVVFHGAGTQRVELGVDGKVFLRQARVVAHDLHFRNRRQAGCLFAQQCRGNIRAGGRLLRRLCLCTAAAAGLFEYQHGFLKHLISCLPITIVISRHCEERSDEAISGRISQINEIAALRSQ